MPTALFRFHGELEDLLPAARRTLAFERGFAPGATLKHAIEALDVPHTEIGAVTVDGQPARLEDRLGDGRRIDVYPMAPAQHPPETAPRFIADAHLGALARRLRLLGFDTVLATDGADHELAMLADTEDRILLSRDRELLKHRRVRRGRFVRAIRRDEQLREVVRQFGLREAIRPFSRCLECNAPLRAVARERVLHRLPEGVAQRQDAFTACEGCGRVYWTGTHWRRLAEIVDALAVDRTT